MYVAPPCLLCRSETDDARCMCLSGYAGNTIFEPNKEGSHYKGSGSGSGDKEETKKDDKKDAENKS